MIFEDALLIFPAPERCKYEECEAFFAQVDVTTYQFVENLHVEYRLTWNIIFEIMNQMIIGHPDISSIQKEITNVCRKYRLQGGVVALPHETKFGRAVTDQSFKERLINQGAFYSIDEANSIVPHFSDGNVNSVQKLIGEFYMHEFIVWATFNSEFPNQDPFRGMPKDADGIRSRLGLDPNDKGKDLFLLIYELPADVKPHFPTIANAYAGDSWHNYFHPAPKGCSWGLTYPWDKDLKPCPEIVHKPVKYDCLIGIDIARGVA